MILIRAKSELKEAYHILRKYGYSFTSQGDYQKVYFNLDEYHDELEYLERVLNLKYSVTKLEK